MRRESTEMTSRVTTNRGTVCQIYLTLLRPSAFLELVYLDSAPTNLWDMEQRGFVYRVVDSCRYRVICRTSPTNAYANPSTCLVYTAVCICHMGQTHKKSIHHWMSCRGDTRSSVSHVDSNIVLLEKGYHHFFRRTSEMSILTKVRLTESLNQQSSLPTFLSNRRKLFCQYFAEFDPFRFYIGQYIIY